MNSIKEYEDAFERMHTYFQSRKIDTMNLTTFSKFKQAAKKIQWDMNEEGQKVFYKYQRVYLQQTGVIEISAPTKECRVTIAGNIVCRLPRITSNGQVRHYWTSEKRAAKFGYRLKLPKKISKKPAVVNQWKKKKK
jgi:hypothetical protein